MRALIPSYIFLLWRLLSRGSALVLVQMQQSCFLAVVDLHMLKQPIRLSSRSAYPAKTMLCLDLMAWCWVSYYYEDSLQVQNQFFFSLISYEKVCVFTYKYFCILSTLCMYCIIILYINSYMNPKSLMCVTHKYIVFI